MSSKSGTPLNDFITLQRGFDLPSQDRKNGNVPIVASTGVVGTHDEIRVKAPGVVIGRSGSIGGGQYVTTDFWPLNTTLWVKDFKGHNPRYIYYLLKSIDFKQFNVGSGVPTLNRNHLSSVLVRDIGLEQEEKLASIVGAIDDKFELNNQINQTLEAMAQAIFKSWFVDFEPVKAKMAVLQAGGSQAEAEFAAMMAISGKTSEQLSTMRTTQAEAYQQLTQTAALFPAAMQESGLGDIPEGWEVTTFGKVSLNFDSKRIPLSKPQRQKKQPGSVPYYGATSVMDYVNEWIFDDIYLLIGEDGSVLKEDGTPFVQYIWGKSWVNNHAHVLKGTNGVSTEHLMIFIQNQNITPYVTGAVQLKLNQGNLNSIPFIYAGTDLNEAFSKVIGPFFSSLRCIAEENKSLIELRDSLLPRLLSGEIDLSALDEVVA